MANINDDTSVGRDSVFDWGSSGSSKVRLSSIEGKGTKTNFNNQDTESPASRYDPSAMSRIVDITDLVDDSDDDDDDNIIGNSSYKLQLLSFNICIFIFSFLIIS